MNVLFYFGHPAQFHFGKNIIFSLLEKGHHVKILLKTKDVLENLVKESELEYENIQESIRKNNPVSILQSSFQRTIRVFKKAQHFNADILIGTDSSIAQAAFLLRKPALTTLEDDYNIIKKLAKLTYPFTTSIVVPGCCDVGRKWNKKKVPYSGYMKLAYLHPKRFTPDKKIVEKYIQTSDYCLIRLAQLTAHHDKGINGLDKTLVTHLINTMEEKGFSVYISSETKQSDIPEKYQLKIRESDIHHVMAFSSLLVSDSQSMSVEAAMLGVPSLRFSDFAGRISVLEELENIYQLTFGIPSNAPEKLLESVSVLLSDKHIRETFLDRRKEMLSDKIDVTGFMTWFIENFPESRKTVILNSNYQYRFK